MKPDNLPKTLLILTPGFPKNETESVMVPTKQVFIRELNNNFPNLNIIILTFRLPATKSAYKWHQNTVISFGENKKGKINTIIRWFRIWATLKKLNNQHNIIGIISFWCTECALIGKYFGLNKNIKHFSWISGQDAKRENKLVKLIRPQPEELVAMSDFLVKEFDKNHKVKANHIIPNGIDPTRFDLATTKKDIDVLGASSLSPQKHYDIFIDIIKELRLHLPAIRAMICGGGEEENKLKLVIEKHQLQNNISLLGTTEHSKTLRSMQSARVFLHTSSYEGFSTVCIEALYAGAHVISFTKPMEENINHWHIVNTKVEMIEKALAILTDPNTDYQPVMPYLMSDSAKAFMKLFSYSE